jgi:hypothetical protein
MLWHWFLWIYSIRYEPPGMLPAAVSFLAKIYDSKKEQLPR